MSKDNGKVEEGDVVVLKSGGPPMTVVGFKSGSGRFSCQWFEGIKLQSGEFKEVALRHSTEADERGFDAELI